MKLVKIIVVLLFSLALTACASRYTLTQEQRTAAYADYITAEALVDVKKINAFRLVSWQALGEGYIILNANLKKPYLLKLRAQCNGLDYAQAIKINQTGSTLQAKFDSITVLSDMRLNCRISHIYALTKEQKEQMLAIGKVKKEAS